jgi:hypothetical protein
MNQLDPNSQEYQMLNAARFNKILSNLANDPETFGQYLVNDYGINPAIVGDMISESRQQNLQNELSTINQYYQDFQAEINRRTEINPNDPLIPYLNIARAEKISSINESQMKAVERLQKDALDMFKILGVAYGTVADVLGLPEGATTADFYDKQGRLAISQEQLNISKSTLDISRARLTLDQQQAQQKLANISPEVQIIYGEFLKQLSTDKDLTIDKFLISQAGIDTNSPQSGIGPNQINPYSWYEKMSQDELFGLSKIAKEMGHIAKEEDMVIKLFEQINKSKALDLELQNNTAKK